MAKRGRYVGERPPVFPVGDPTPGRELGPLRDMIVAAISMTLAGGAAGAPVAQLLTELTAWVKNCLLYTSDAADE